MKNKIKNILPLMVREKIWEWYWLITNRKMGVSYSQYGEDILLIKSNVLPINKRC
ncbi:MAG: hypothetical protein WCP24_01650 [bacterium]